MPDRTTRLFVLGSFVNACCAEVARLPGPGESLLATRFTSEPGGKGFNVAAGARRLGAAVDCLVAIGDDPFGGLAEAAFAAAGLHDALVRRYPVPTGAGVGLIQANGENVVAVCPGANLHLSAADVRAAAADIAAADLVTAQFELADAPIIEAFTLARRAGTPTLLNPSPYRVPPAAVLAATTVVVANESEARDLARDLGEPAERMDASAARRLAERLRPHGPQILVVTLGARGALAFDVDGASLFQPAFVVVPVDTLGAGDAFVAALAVGLAAGQSLAVALPRAAAAGAVMAGRAGTFAALPTRADIEAMLTQKGSNRLGAGLMEGH